MKIKAVAAITILLALLSLFAGVVESCQTTTSEKPLQVIHAKNIVEEGFPPPPQPVIEITMKNIGEEPVISLSASIDTQVGSAHYTFDVTASNPLTPGNTVSASESLFGGYKSPLQIRGKLQSGKTFNYEVELNYPG